MSEATFVLGAYRSRLQLGCLAWNYTPRWICEMRGTRNAISRILSWLPAACAGEQIDAAVQSMRLVEAGLAACRLGGFGWAVVLAEPAYFSVFSVVALQLSVAGRR